MIHGACDVTKRGAQYEENGSYLANPLAICIEEQMAEAEWNEQDGEYEMKDTSEKRFWVALAVQ